MFATTAAADCGARVKADVGSVMEDVLPEGLSTEVREVLWLIGARETKLSLNPNKGAAGEIGSWQILPSTASPYLKEGEDLEDVYINARVAAAYFQDLLVLSDGDFFSAVAAYNHGPKAIDKVRKGKDLPKVTANYLVWVIQQARRSSCEKVLAKFSSVVGR